jgi:hypothetical protein
MSRKSTKNYSKLLGGLGAMYALSKLPVGEGVRPEDVNQEDAAADREATRQRVERNRVDGLPAPALTSRKKGGAVKASRRADGIAQRGKTRGKMY